LATSPLLASYFETNGKNAANLFDILFEQKKDIRRQRDILRRMRHPEVEFTRIVA